MNEAKSLHLLLSPPHICSRVYKSALEVRFSVLIWSYVFQRGPMHSCLEAARGERFEARGRIAGGRRGPPAALLCLSPQMRRAERTERSCPSVSLSLCLPLSPPIRSAEKRAGVFVSRPRAGRGLR